MRTNYDYIIRNAKVFDGGPAPLFEDVAVRDGRIAARGADLTDATADRVIDANQRWLIPGMFDIHTHYDLELEVSPHLPESTRHGTTSVVIANCSLGLAFGAQRRDGFDPIVDCYARVENVPKPILRNIADKVDWDSPQAYLDHLQQCNLGPNVVPLLPHSMLRIEVMGFADSISRDPTSAELKQMRELLSDALDRGYAGFSTDALPFHYLANQPHTDKVIPTQYAKYAELKALTDVVRERDAVWQATPAKDSVIDVLRSFLLTSGRLFGKPLKTTVVAAMDVHSSRKILPMGLVLARLLNSRWVQGRFYLQALGAPFKVWADGAVTPLAEEIPELRALNEIDIEDRDGRAQLLRNPDFIARFKAMWMKGKRGYSLARIKRLLRLEDYAFNREMADMLVERCPLSEWEGHSFAELFERVCRHNRGESVDLSDAERALVDKDFFWISDEADFVIQVLRSFDLQISWSTVSANRKPGTVRKLLMNPDLLPGFNDSGAHLTNMAFYDCNLRALKLAAEGGDADVAYMVRRLTRDAAEVFGVSGGSMAVGDQADLALIDPERLAGYDGEAGVIRRHREEFDHEQLVNRSDTVVPMVMIGGKVIWENDQFVAEAGKASFGRVLQRKGARSSEVAA